LVLFFTFKKHNDVILQKALFLYLLHKLAITKSHGVSTPWLLVYSLFKRLLIKA